MSQEKRTVVNITITIHDEMPTRVMPSIFCKFLRGSMEFLLVKAGISGSTQTDIVCTDRTEIYTKEG